jgi:glutamine amidotransferase
VSVAVVNLGVGNTASVMFALDRLGADAVLTDDARVIDACERVVLPGVGAAAHAMALLERRGLRQTIAAFARPLLGICLGQQLLFDESDEGAAKGLGLLPGRVFRLPSSPRLPSPHMGWSRVAKTRDHPLTEGLEEGVYCYFVHAYACPAGDDALAVAEHGVPFAAMVARGNVFGCQFHPERSGAAGARVLANFLALPC